MGIITLLRIAAVFAVVWLLYKGVKTLFAGSKDAAAKVNSQGRGEVLDVMVQDPQCGVFLPRHDALSARISGKAHYFCSQKCRDDFVSVAKKNKQ